MKNRATTITLELECPRLCERVSTEIDTRFRCEFVEVSVLLTGASVL